MGLGEAHSTSKLERLKWIEAEAKLHATEVMSDVQVSGGVPWVGLVLL